MPLAVTDTSAGPAAPAAGGPASGGATAERMRRLTASRRRGGAALAIAGAALRLAGQPQAAALDTMLPLQAVLDALEEERAGFTAAGPAPLPPWIQVAEIGNLILLHWGPVAGLESGPPPPEACLRLSRLVPAAAVASAAANFSYSPALLARVAGLDALIAAVARDGKISDLLRGAGPATLLRQLPIICRLLRLAALACRDLPPATALDCRDLPPPASAASSTAAPASSEFARAAVQAAAEELLRHAQGDSFASLAGAAGGPAPRREDVFALVESMMLVPPHGSRSFPRGGLSVPADYKLGPNLRAMMAAGVDSPGFNVLEVNQHCAFPFPYL